MHSHVSVLQMPLAAQEHCLETFAGPKSTCSVRHHLVHKAQPKAHLQGTIISDLTQAQGLLQ